MTTNAGIGYGSTMQIDNAAGTLTDVGEIVAIGGPGARKATPDATHMGSPSRTQEFISGLHDPGEVSVTLNYTPAQASNTHILEIHRAQASRTYAITWPDGASVTGELFVSSVEPAVQVGDKMELTFTAKLTGVQTYAAS